MIQALIKIQPEIFNNKVSSVIEYPVAFQMEEILR